MQNGTTRILIRLFLAMNQTEWFFLYFVNFPPLICRQFPVPPPYIYSQSRDEGSLLNGWLWECHLQDKRTLATSCQTTHKHHSLTTQLLISLWSNFSIRKIINNFSSTTYHIHLQSSNFAFMPRCRRSVTGVQTVYNTKPKKLDSISRQWPRLPGKAWKLAVINYAEPCCLLITQ